MKVYLAGSLFNEAEIAQRKLEGKIMRERFPQFDIFNPIDQPFNQDKSSLPTSIAIFEGDANAVRECDIFIADLTNDDAGVMMELGMAVESKTPIIIGINSDIRLPDAHRYDIPTYGMNHFVLGGILKYGHFVRSFNEAMDLLETLI